MAGRGKSTITRAPRLPTTWSSASGDFLTLARMTSVRPSGSKIPASNEQQDLAASRAAARDMPERWAAAMPVREAPTVLIASGTPLNERSAPWRQCGTQDAAGVVPENRERLPAKEVRIARVMQVVSAIRRHDRPPR